MDELNLLDQKNTSNPSQGNFLLEKHFKKWQEQEQQKSQLQKKELLNPLKKDSLDAHTQSRSIERRTTPIRINQNGIIDYHRASSNDWNFTNNRLQASPSLAPAQTQQEVNKNSNTSVKNSSTEPLPAGWKNCGTYAITKSGLEVEKVIEK